jgi:predicted lipoprotein with Yx(FWY)xxD motif
MDTMRDAGRGDGRIGVPVALRQGGGVPCEVAILGGPTRGTDMKSSSRGRKQRGRRGAFLALPALAAAGAVLTLAACSPSAASPGSSPSTASSPSPSTAPAAGATALSVRSTALGTILTDGRGFTLYAFGADKGTTSNCSGACATAWPPVTTTSISPQIGTGVKQSLVGQTTRADHTKQLTYAGHPVYLFVHDSAPGSTSGQGLQAFGARWDVLTATGREVTTGTSASTSAPSSSVPSPTCTIPQNNGGDHDADNNGGPDDGDGCDK